MDTMDLLNYGWASYLSAIMGLAPATFQLAQGALGLQTSDSSGLFLMADAVPPAGDVHFYDATSMNKRSSAYLGLLGALLPENNPNALTTALGAQYPAWVAWKTANPPLPAENYMAWFSRWGTRNGIDPGLLTQASISIMQAQNTPLIQAYNAYTNPAGWQLFFNTAGGSYTLPTYSTTHQAATSAIAAGSSIPSLNFDSGTILASRGGGMGPKPPGTALKGLFGGILEAGVADAGSGLFRRGTLGATVAAGANSAVAQLDARASGQRVTIVGRIGSYAILPSSPGSWYSSGEVVRALNGKGSQAIWDAGAASGGWSSFFGANSGSLARYVSQLVLISDYQLNVTVYGQFRAQDVTLLNSAALPAWPLFAQSPNYQLNSDATVSAVHQSSSANAIQIWGVSVQTV